MMVDIFDDFADAVSKSAGVQQTESGKLGYSVGGAFLVVDPSDPKKFFVRYPNGNWVSAFHYNRVPQKPNFPVLTSKDNLGRTYIVGEDATTSQSFLAPTSGGASVGWHIHPRGGGMDFITDSWLLKQLRVTPIAGTLSVTVAQGSYIFNKTLCIYDGETVDLTSYVPTSTEAVVWVMIALNPLTNQVVVLSGTPFLGELPPSLDLITEIQSYQLGYIPLSAVWLVNGDSSIPPNRVENLVYRTGGAAWYLEDLMNYNDSYYAYDGYVLTREHGYWIPRPPQGGSGGSGTDSDAIHSNVAGEIEAIAEKTSLDGGDLFVIEDEADSFNKKRMTADNVLASVGGGSLAALVPWTTLGSDQASISLPAISGLYNTLELYIEARTDRAGNTNDDLIIRFNTDTTAANYRTGGIVTISTGDALQFFNGATIGGICVFDGATGATAGSGYFSVFSLTIYDYTSAARKKLCEWRGAIDLGTGSSGSFGPLYGSGSWIATAAAITQIDILPRNGTVLKAGSSYALYAR